MDESADYGYVATKPCGCRVGWVSESMPPKDRAKAVGRWMRSGYQIERELVQLTREGPAFGCKCGKVKQGSLL